MEIEKNNMFKSIKKTLFKISLRFFLWKNNIVVKQASSEKELEKVYNFRWKIYSQEEYINPDNYPDKLLKDKYDSVSVSFLALKNQRIIGTLRLVPFSPLGLPTENAFNFSHFKLIPEKTAEISKLCVSKDWRGKGIALALIEKAYLYSKEKGICYWLVGIPPALKDYFEKFGIKFQSISTNSPTQTNLRERKTAEKYFGKKSIHPYSLNLKEL